jgi:hypothetical protein
LLVWDFGYGKLNWALTRMQSARTMKLMVRAMRTRCPKYWRKGQSDCARPLDEVEITEDAQKKAVRDRNEHVFGVRVERCLPWHCTMMTSVQLQLRLPISYVAKCALGRS